MIRESVLKVLKMHRLCLVLLDREASVHRANAEFTLCTHVPHGVRSVIIFLDGLFFRFLIGPDIPRQLVYRAGRLARFLKVRIFFCSGVTEEVNPRASVRLNDESSLSRVKTFEYALMSRLRAEPELLLESGSSLSVMIADDRSGSGLGPASSLVKNNTSYLSGMLVDCFPGMIDLPVKIQSAVFVFRPELAHERMRIPEVDRPVSGPRHRNTVLVLVVVRLGKLVTGDNVNVASVVLVNDALSRDPESFSKPLIPHSGQRVELHHVSRAVSRDLFVFGEQNRIILMNTDQHSGRTLV